MRLPLFKPTDAQAAALRARVERLQRPAAMLELLRSALATDVVPSTIVTCAPLTAHRDRVVLRVQTRRDSGEECVYSVKCYSDDIAERVWTFTQAVADRVDGTGNDRLGLPIAYAKHEWAVVSPWIEGAPLSDITNTGKSALLRRAGSLTATLHRLAVVPEPATTTGMLIDETRARSERLRARWPDTLPLVEPLLEMLQQAALSLEPAHPAPVHGDLGGAQFLWTGNRLILFDWDRFGYADPAFDVGHFLAQLDRTCIQDPAQRPYATQWISSFADSYSATMPGVSRRNVAFYRAMTLLWKIHTICRVQPAAWPQLVPQLARAARSALQSAADVPTR